MPGATVCEPILYSHVPAAANATDLKSHRTEVHCSIKCSHWNQNSESGIILPGKPTSFTYRYPIKPEQEQPQGAKLQPTFNPTKMLLSPSIIHTNNDLK
ncbi:hypothetical protein DMENIID0001_104100 [Sergentomyia squamirostris]